MLPETNRATHQAHQEEAHKDQALQAAPTNQADHAPLPEAQPLQEAQPPQALAHQTATETANAKPRTNAQPDQLDQSEKPV